MTPDELLRDPDDAKIRADTRRSELTSERIMGDFLRGMSLLDAAMLPVKDVSPRDPGDEDGQ